MFCEFKVYAYSLVLFLSASDNNCTDGDIRLVGGSTSSEGIVEMCLGGHYGYICQDEMGTNDKKGILTCEQLGYDPAGEKSAYIIYNLYT